MFRVLTILLPAVCLPLCAAARSRTVWDGVYSAAQASRGEAAYAAECSRCHKDDLSGYNNALIGARFMDRWREDNLKNFYDLVKNTMPRNAPASLSDAQYADIVAYVLQVNAFPAGAGELRAENAADVRIQGKTGPAPVPDFALVEVAGCLTQRADGQWIVTRATEPVRTRNPSDSSAEELRAWQGKEPGLHAFRLMDATYVNSKPPNGQMVLAKGLLIRQTGDDRLNTSALQGLGVPCNAAPR